MENGKEIDNRIVEEVLEVMEEAEKECTPTSTSLSVGHVLREVFFDYLERTNDTPETRRIKEALYGWAIRLIFIQVSCT